MQINAPFNPVSAKRARDLLGVTSLLNPVTQIGLRELGFIGDGNAHPLSARFPTLAAAQVAFPRAQALTEEIDGNAIQLFIDRHHASGAAPGPLGLYLPYGCYARASRPILSGLVATSVYGINSFITWVVQGSDGWVHGSASSGWQSKAGSRFEMKGVNLCCMGVGGTALWVEQDPQTGGCHLTSVRIVGSGDLKTNYWNRGSVCIGTSDLLWEKVSIVGSLGGNLMTKNTAIYVTYDTTKFGSIQGSFFYRFNNCDVSWYNIGYDLLATKTIEGIYIQGGNINSCLTSVRFNNTTVDQGGGYPSPQLFILNNQIEGYGTYFDLKAVQYVHIRGNLFLVNAARDGVADPGAFLWDWMILRQQACDIDVSGNKFQFFDKSSPRYLVNADALGVQNIFLHDNTFKWTGTARLGGGIINYGAADPTKAKVREWNNVGLSGYYWAFSNGDGRRANGNYSQADIENRVRSQGDAVLGFNYDTGKVTIQATRLVTVGASGGNYVAPFAVEAGVFAAKPSHVTPAYGDPFGVISGEVPLFDPAASSATSIAIRVVGFNPSGAGNRVMTVTATG